MQPEENALVRSGISNAKQCTVNHVNYFMKHLTVHLCFVVAIQISFLLVPVAPDSCWFCV